MQHQVAHGQSGRCPRAALLALIGRMQHPMPHDRHDRRRCQAQTLMCVYLMHATGPNRAIRGLSD
jgi:hypothetical protein